MKLIRVSKGGGAPLFMGSIPPAPKKKSEVAKSFAGNKVGRGAAPIWGLNVLGAPGAINMRRRPSGKKAI